MHVIPMDRPEAYVDMARAVRPWPAQPKRAASTQHSSTSHVCYPSNCSVKASFAPRVVPEALPLVSLSVYKLPEKEEPC